MERRVSFYEKVSSPFGPVVVVWRQAPSGPTVRRIFLPEKEDPCAAAQSAFSGIQPRSCPAMEDLAARIRRFLTGEDIDFSLQGLAWETCGEFQRKVLRAEYEIPRGWVSTYGLLAQEVGSPGGGRAAGRALAENPFPIVIPCHRAVRADGGLGGYQGGHTMKRALLEMEGVEFDRRGRVRMDRVYYA